MTMIISTSIACYAEQVWHGFLWYGLWFTFFFFHILPDVLAMIFVYAIQSSFPLKVYFGLALGGMLVFDVLHMVLGK